MFKAYWDGHLASCEFLVLMSCSWLLSWCALHLDPLPVNPSQMTRSHFIWASLINYFCSWTTSLNTTSVDGPQNTMEVKRAHQLFGYQYLILCSTIILTVSPTFDISQNYISNLNCYTSWILWSTYLVWSLFKEDTSQKYESEIKQL